MEVKIGDRFRNEDDGWWIIWEVDVDGIPTVIDRGSSNFDVGYKNIDWYFDSMHDTYLGNFAKSNNFKLIYDILSDGN
jgi:hypothetical protein